MNIEEFKQQGHQLIDWIADYYSDIENHSVKSKVKPKEIYNRIPAKAPAKEESFDQLIHDFEDKILPGITHWQHPSFFAYFNANTSFPSNLGELLTSAIGAQCMIWDTSPAAAELEERICEWIQDAAGLPENWHGVIQDTASTATLCALLMAREKYSKFEVNRSGFSELPKFRIYCSAEAHSSIEKGVKIAGFGSDNLIKIPVDDKLAMIPDALEKHIDADKESGYMPISVIAAVGSTGTHAIDPVRAIGEVCRKHKLFYHVDAAHAGNATVLEDFRWLIDGIELADSYVFNPHKWMFTNFDCSLFYTRDKDTLLKTFEIMPEYLKTENDLQVNNYRDWGIQLGRRFRALKLWFVIRSFGMEGIRAKFRSHIQLAKYFTEVLEANADFEILAPVPLNLVCFRYNPGEVDEKGLNILNQKLEQRINDSGSAYITHTKVDGRYTLRACIGQTNVEKKHVDQLLDLLNEEVKAL